MKQKLLFLLVAVLMSASAWAEVGDEFTADGLKYKVTGEAPKTVELTRYDGEKPMGDLVIPVSVGGYSVTSIGDGAFYDCSGLTSITIPNGVTSIGENVFYRCYGLTSIEIPNSVTSIGKMAFWCCQSLTSIVIPNSVTRIGFYAFSGCKGLTSIEIPNSVTSIRSGEFQGCSGLTSIEIPNSVIAIGTDAFSGCTGLTSIKIPNGMTYIDDWAFSGCSGLTDIYCYANPEDLTWKEDVYAFKSNKETLCHVEADKLSTYNEKFPQVNVTFVGDLETNAIENITADTTDGAWYTLTGVKLDGEPTAPGIYVKDGRKVVVK